MELALPYRSASAQCPRCDRELTAGPLHRCTRCAGTWIDEQTLSEHVGTMTNAPAVSLEWSVDDDRERLPCAACRQPMDALLLLDVPVDRCAPHGVWFDKAELACVLERTAIPPAVAPVAVTPGTADPLAGSVALEVAGEVAFGATTEVAVEVAASGVLEGVLEILGAIFSVIDL